MTTDTAAETAVEPLRIADREFNSRLILGTGKYSDPETAVRAFEASGTEMITVALRRVNLDELGKGTIIDQIDQSKYLLLPNTAGCYTAEDAVRTA
ncbi:MAG: thiazole synthase, partial [Acidobacteriota bacterium]|nr:thiazole synthase [Acidobacteriota bacterium]